MGAPPPDQEKVTEDLGPKEPFHIWYKEAALPRHNQKFDSLERSEELRTAHL
jgi:hypothetical protein